MKRAAQYGLTAAIVTAFTATAFSQLGGFEREEAPAAQPPAPPAQERQPIEPAQPPADPQQAPRIELPDEPAVEQEDEPTELVGKIVDVYSYLEAMEALEEARPQPRIRPRPEPRQPAQPRPQPQQPGQPQQPQQPAWPEPGSEAPQDGDQQQVSHLAQLDGDQPMQIQPRQPQQPAQPARPVEPAQPARPVEPVEPARPVQPQRPELELDTDAINERIEAGAPVGVLVEPQSQLRRMRGEKDLFLIAFDPTEERYEEMLEKVQQRAGEPVRIEGEAHFEDSVRGIKAITPDSVEAATAEDVEEAAQPQRPRLEPLNGREDAQPEPALPQRPQRPDQADDVQPDEEGAPDEPAFPEAPGDDDNGLPW